MLGCKMVSICLKGFKSYRIKIENNNKQIPSKSMHIWKLGSKLMGNLWVKGKKTQRKF